MGYSDYDLSWFSLDLPGEFRDSTLKLAMTAYFQIVSYLSFAYHTVIRRYIVLVTKKGAA
jgi:hypothetical protein